MNAPVNNPTVTAGSTGWRLARTLLLVSVTAWLGCFAHVLGGGQLAISGLAVGLSLPLISGVFALTRFRLNTLACLPLLALGQVAVHWLLMIPSSGQAGILAGSPVGASAAASGEAHARMSGAAGMDHAEMMAHHSMETSGMAMDHGSLPMFAAHVLGTIVAAVFLGAVDATIWILATLIVPWIARLTRHLLIPRLRAPLGVTTAFAPPLKKRFHTIIPVRGPPLFLTTP